MAGFTEKAIKASFMKLLNEKPLKQISVRDIVDGCGVNRNTFYYHFQDIPSLIGSIIKDDADRIMKENPRFTSIEECLNTAIVFSLENQRAILHIYRSVNRDIFEQYQWRVCDYVVTSYFDEILKDRNVSDKDRKVLITYGTCLCFGVIIGWLENDLSEDINKLIHRLCILKQGELDRMIDICERSR